MAVLSYNSADAARTADCRFVLGVLTGWLDRRERQALAYLMEENRVLRRQPRQGWQGRTEM